VKFISGIEDLASTVKWPRWFERVRRWAPPSAETGYTGCIRPWAIVAKVCETNKKKTFYSQKQARIKCNLITRDRKNWKKPRADDIDLTVLDLKKKKEKEKNLKLASELSFFPLSLSTLLNAFFRLETPRRVCV
jgi:hypothetical protein